MKILLRLLLGLALLATPFLAHADDAEGVTNKAAAYTRTITERADKIVALLNLPDEEKEERVRDIIVRQYRDLNAIHEVRDAQIKAAREKTPDDKAAISKASKLAHEEAQPKLDQLHGEFLARLRAELTPGQVNRVKDGLTYGVVRGTYNVYLKMYPELTKEQRHQIMAWLIEAREQAMDGSTANEKHAVFGKYKGRINNYLSQAGYDSKKGEQNLKAAKPKPEPKTP